MSTFKKLAGQDNFSSTNNLRTNDLVANTITTNKISIDLSGTDANLFYWDLCGDAFYHDKSVSFPGEISGTTGKFMYKILSDVSTSWQTITDNSRVILRNKETDNYDKILNNELLDLDKYKRRGFQKLNIVLKINDILLINKKNLDYVNYKLLIKLIKLEIKYVNKIKNEF